MILVQVSNSEIIDKITILELKLKYIKDEDKLFNIKKEYEYLLNFLNIIGISTNDLIYKELYEINDNLWHIEEQIRLYEKDKIFNKDFIELARKVYFLNDKRAAIKKRISLKSNSNFVEEKSYVV